MWHISFLFQLSFVYTNCVFEFYINSVVSYTKINRYKILNLSMQFCVIEIDSIDGPLWKYTTQRMYWKCGIGENLARFSYKKDVGFDTMSNRSSSIRPFYFCWWNVLLLEGKCSHQVFPLSYRHVKHVRSDIFYIKCPNIFEVFCEFQQVFYL